MQDKERCIKYIHEVTQGDYASACLNVNSEEEQQRCSGVEGAIRNAELLIERQNVSAPANASDSLNASRAEMERVRRSDRLASPLTLGWQELQEQNKTEKMLDDMQPKLRDMFSSVMSARKEDAGL